MSDYMFMLESHLTGEQAKAVAAVRDAAEQARLNLFLTGGAMRDMLGGFPIRDLDFTVEGPAIKLAKEVAERSGAQILAVDELRKSVELMFPGGVPASIGTARQETYPKPAGKPQVQPATIHEDLRGRDFTVNAIALSLGKASRGLLLDPTNGLGDLTAKELRTVTNHALSDDPSRILRLFRLKSRLGFTIPERTMSQYANVREAKLETKIPAAAFRQELQLMAAEPLVGDIFKTLDEERLLEPLLPGLSGARLNVPAFQKLQKVRLSLPPGDAVRVDWFTLTLHLLTEKLSARERAQLIATLGIDKPAADNAAKLDTRSTKIEKDLAKARIARPSSLYSMLSPVSGELLLYLLMHSGQRLVIDRIKNYLQKYLPLALEITEKDVIDAGGQPGTPKFDKLRHQLIAAKLDARPKKVVPEEPPPPPPATNGRRSSSFARSITS